MLEEEMITCLLIFIFLLFLKPINQCGFAYAFWASQIHRFLAVNAQADCVLPEPSAVWFSW